MSNETPNTDPLDFMKGMWGNMGFSLPGMVTPTFDTDELEKRIADLKAVEGWLRMNLSMLQMTIQGLEMQHSTLSAVKAMSQMATERPATAPAAAADSEEAPPAAAMWPWTMMQQMHAHLNQQATPATEAAPEAAAKPAARKPAPEKPAAGRRTKKQ
ncbi:MAG: hypothetical protein RBT86_05415 [Azospira sp.]|jgi:hypothetical protein|nr:hypothetical protein [Azospira sp.]